MYEIRFIKDDGKATLIYITPFSFDALPAGLTQSVAMMNYHHAEIWLDGERVRTEYRCH